MSALDGRALLVVLLVWAVIVAVRIYRSPSWLDLRDLDREDRS